MRNFVQDGGVLNLTAPAGGVTSGVGVLIGNIFAVPMVDAAAGEQFSGAVEGVFDLAKTAGDSFAAGDIVYFDAGTGEVTSTVIAGARIGAAIQAAAGADTTARVRLDERSTR